MRKFIKSMWHAHRGFLTVAKEEQNFKIHIVVAIIVIAAGFLFKLSQIEWVAIVIAIVLVLGAEMVNTAIEDLCDVVEPGHHPTIGKIKDVMAGFVLLSSIAAVVIGLIVFLNHF